MEFLADGIENRPSIAAKCSCFLCSKEGQTIDRCYLDPLNPNNKLELPLDATAAICAPGKSKGRRNGGSRKINPPSNEAIESMESASLWLVRTKSLTEAEALAS